MPAGFYEIGKVWGGGAGDTDSSERRFGDAGCQNIDRTDLMAERVLGTAATQKWFFGLGRIF